MNEIRKSSSKTFKIVRDKSIVVMGKEKLLYNFLKLQSCDNKVIFTNDMLLEATKATNYSISSLHNAKRNLVSSGLLVRIREKALKKVSKYEGLSYKSDEYRRACAINHHYGISYDQLLELYKKCNNRCSICGIEEKDIKGKLHVDHCHDTGKIRGLLCKNCNVALGHFKDNVDLLKKAINYLQ
jgi:hypothetical protein